jgi:cytochrome b561
MQLSLEKIMSMARELPLSRSSVPAPGLRYSAGAQLFHWLTALLVGTAYVLSPGGSEQRIYAAGMDATREWHESVGMVLFAVVLLRLLWRMFSVAPEPVPMAAWMHTSSRVAHWALYALLLAIPLTAIVGAWLEAHPLTILGIGDIAPMFAPAHDIGASLAYIHTILGNAILWLAGLHAAAALFHHYVLRDGTLLAMLPSWKQIRFAPRASAELRGGAEGLPLGMRPGCKTIINTDRTRSDRA